ncbi:MAG: hypothetical protein JWM27_3911 [Gemmatimonadetes bacterium]|nr:hypothetical protein [Gemmatimonadota bacterium]
MKKSYEIHVGYEDVAPDIVRVPGSLPRAGIFLLDGGYRVAAFGSRAERRLVDDGALLVAHLRFDRDPREGPYTGAGVEPVAVRDVARRFAAAASGN